MHGRLISDERVRPAVVALIFASLLCLAMLGGRTIFAGRLQLGFYIWNLVLAWLPLLFALRFYRLDAVHPPRSGWLAVWAVPWFLFFPNAPYLVTDMLHLKSRDPVPKWFDLTMMMSFAWTGLILGYLSLLLMQEVVRRRQGRTWGWVFAGTMLALSSFGIYLGRFLRWNSWDVLTRPLGLAGDVAERLDFLKHPEMTMFCVTFFAFSILSYATLYALTHLHMSEPVAPIASE